MDSFTISDANVEDMSNAELFQYLFKAELGADLPESVTDSLFNEPPTSPDSPSSTLSTVAQSPPNSLSSPSPSNQSSPITSTYDSPSPLSPYTQDDIMMQQTQLFQPLVQLQTSPISTPLPSTMFSYRQLTPDMPPSMPTQASPVNVADTTNIDNQFLNLAATATGSSSISSTSSTTPSDQMTIWLQRFQQLQQHHYQQRQQLLISPLYSPSSSSDSTNFGSIQSSVKAESRVIYPSPPMKDDMSMESDSDDGHNREDNNDSDPLKPSASELKKMTSKERRQLRNKLSARNFRVRRKEYISTLENQVKDARKEAAELQKKLAQSELSCQYLRQELEAARLSQSLFNDNRLPKEHANLLASLLNPNTEAFPTTSDISTEASALLQQKELMDSINSNNMTILNNSLTAAQTSSSMAMDTPHGSLQPYVPFEGNWDLIINRAEFTDPVIDPKDTQSKEDIQHGVLARYEVARHEAEVDEQMRTELRAFHEKQLSKTYIVMPKEESMYGASWVSQESVILQTMVYMMMIHLTRTLFEAATLSNTQLIDVYRTMDEPLRSKMGKEQQEEVRTCKFREWREAWMKKYWPSFYNNRQRVCELLKNGICPSASLTGVDVDETVRKMEEGVKDKTVESQPLCVWLCNCISSWLRCHESMAKEEAKPLLPEATLEAI
ncbi:hypothetical protein BGZ76_003308 [Entomortierella beljakovae]|nr:hypothetical protein BGZ76_003308 [Entomortierella beljakovae]